ncbi:MAG TPA: sensor histidine kinase [Mycobacteriales bacterium]|nr:sensor histidine kinase [Mycobacteriales bacterium]
MYATRSNACREDVPSPLITEGWPPRARFALRNAVSIVLVVQTLTAVRQLSDQALAVSLVLLVVAVTAAATFINRREADVIDHVAMCVMVAAGAGLHATTAHGQVYVCGYSAVFVSMWWYGLPWGLVPTLLGIASVGTAAAYVDHGSLGAGLGQAAGAAGMAIAVAFRRRGLLTARRNAQLSDQLRDSREAEQRNAIAAERARLARELHDVLAHTLSSLSLHLESTRVLARSRRVDGEVMVQLERAVALARTGLEEARDAVGTLRDDALPGPARIPRLVSDFARDSGVAAHFAEHGEPVPLEPEARVALFRAVQEALTNVGKHARASRVDVTLDWLEDVVVLRIADDGRGAAATAVGDGNGLRGMRERAELVGGQVSAEPAERGYVVEVRLPLASAGTRS